MKKVNQPRREKFIVLEEKKLTAAKGSSGYLVSTGRQGGEELNPGEGNP